MVKNLGGMEAPLECMLEVCQLERHAMCPHPCAADGYVRDVAAGRHAPAFCRSSQAPFFLWNLMTLQC